MFTLTTVMQNCRIVHRRWAHAVKFVFVCMRTTLYHRHHYADFFENIDHINGLSGILCHVCLRLHIAWMIFQNIHEVSCFQVFTHSNSVDCEIIYTSSNYRHLIPNLIHSILLGVRSWNNDIRSTNDMSSSPITNRNLYKCSYIGILINISYSISVFPLFGFLNTDIPYEGSMQYAKTLIGEHIQMFGYAWHTK